MSLRHGFKSEAEQYANELRVELKLSTHSPLCPWQLANHLDIPVHPLSMFRQLKPNDIGFLLREGATAFSAVTLFLGRHGRKRTIVYNDGNGKPRQAADLAHELSHAILGHPPTKMFEDDPVLDEEAKWMGPCLLVPKIAALWILQQGISEAMAALQYGVSQPLMQMRLRASGAQIIASQRQRKTG